MLKLNTDFQIGSPLMLQSAKYPDLILGQNRCLAILVENIFVHQIEHEKGKFSFMALCEQKLINYHLLQAVEYGKYKDSRVP